MKKIFNLIIIFLLLTGNIFGDTIKDEEEKEIIYETITKAEPKKTSSMKSTSFRLKRTYKVKKGEDLLKYLNLILKDSLNNCKDLASDNYGACFVVSIKYIEKKNPSINSKVFDKDGLTINNINVNWNGIKKNTSSLIKAEKLKLDKKYYWEGKEVSKDDYYYLVDKAKKKAKEDLENNEFQNTFDQLKLKIYQASNLAKLCVMVQKNLQNFYLARVSDANKYIKNKNLNGMRKSLRDFREISIMGFTASGNTDQYCKAGIN